MSEPRYIWTDDGAAPFTLALFRKCFELGDTPTEGAKIRIFADSHYQLFINGTLVARGPSFFHPDRISISTFTISEHLKTGVNVIGVKVLYNGIPKHNTFVSENPGLHLSLSIGDKNIVSDAGWSALCDPSWSTDTFRKGIFLGPLERIDLQKHPREWLDSDYDDSHWPKAHEKGKLSDIATEILESNLPPLKFEKHTGKPRSTYSCPSDLPPLHQGLERKGYGERLFSEDWIANHAFEVNAEGPGVAFKGLNPNEGFVAVFDLERMSTGHFHFHISCESTGLIDWVWSERLLGDKPHFYLKSNCYADRITLKAGDNRWLSTQYNSGRYLAAIGRGFAGKVTINEAGILASTPDLDWEAGAFSCSNTRLKQVWDLCLETLQVSTQEAMMDCPTREQALYLGDGVLTGRWIAALTGDDTHLRFLIDETFAMQSPEGLVPTTTHSCNKVNLVDYDLLAVHAVKRTYHESGDRDFLARHIEGCERIIRYFDRHIDESGLIRIENPPEPEPGMPYPLEIVMERPGKLYDHVSSPLLLNFIDHPGMGWHNIDETGIDRRGCNTALNALYALALQSMAEMRETLEQDGSGYRAAYYEHSELMGKLLWDSDKVCFCDGLVDGQRSEYHAEQTQLLCLVAGIPCPIEPGVLLKRFSDAMDDHTAKCGPYLYTYLLPLMNEHGLGDLALKLVHEKWGKMIDHGADCLWETFSGDELDSLCHPWSAAPIEFVQRVLVGVRCRNGKEITISPLAHLVEELNLRMFVGGGWLKIGWRYEGDEVVFEGEYLGDGEKVWFEYGGVKERVQGKFGFRVLR